MHVHGNLMGMTKSALARDGRRLSYEEHGRPDGSPVFLMHGMPGSRKGPRPRSSVLYLLGVRLIAYDRPGYGGSDRQLGRTIADAAADVRDLADALGIEHFAVAGRSGGAPHALACAALLPERVTRAAALVSFAPYTLMGPRWYDGQTQSNLREHGIAETGAAQLEDYLGAMAAAIKADPESHLPFDEKDLIRPDRAVMADFGIRRMLLDNFREALRQTPYGWIDDSLSFVRPWGFDPASIHCPVRLWHGADDNYAPVTHTRWLGERIPGAETIIQRDAGHFTSIEALPSILSWLS